MSIYKIKMVNGKAVELSADEIKELEARDVEYAKGELDRLMVGIRRERTSLLAECDWMGMSDVTMSAEWKTYRQKLRDITKDVDTVDKAKAVTMPEKPK